MVAAEGAFDEVEGCLRGRDARAKRLGFRTQDVPAPGGITGRGQRTDGAEGQPCLLGPQDDGDAGEIGAPVTAAAGGVADGRQQPHRLPVPQDVRGQAEAFGEGADTHRRARVILWRPVLA
ncbi:hypothetical protein GCM10009535_42950 [Streptomyces thermocarboxydovorans]|uniref:Uncharacterized protein n=1 Tax=Streptomyces thermocarboxydovorans TaxID=59298 RepID=A0ABP3SQL3_9ACTN